MCLDERWIAISSTTPGANETDVADYICKELGFSHMGKSAITSFCLYINCTNKH